MNINNEIRIVGGVIGMLLILLSFLMYDNTSQLRINNELEGEENQITFRQEYERVLLGCNTLGAQESDDRWLRELCDQELVSMHEELFGDG